MAVWKKQITFLLSLTNFYLSRPRGAQQSPETFFIIFAMFSHFQKGKLGLCSTSESWDINVWSFGDKSFGNLESLPPNSNLKYLSSQTCYRHSLQLGKRSVASLYSIWIQSYRSLLVWDHNFRWLKLLSQNNQTLISLDPDGVGRSFWSFLKAETIGNMIEWFLASYNAILSHNK